MFEAYRVAVKLTLINNVTEGLTAITASLKKTDAEAQGLHKRLGMIGMALAGAGAGMLFSLKGPISHMMEWQRELAKMQQMGLGDAQIADAKKFVMASDIIGTSMEQRMKLFTEAQGAFRESGMSGLHALSAAKVMMPVLAQYQTALSVLGGPHQEAAKGAMMQLNKTVELLGGLNDPGRAASIANGVFKAVQSSGKMVSERDLKQFVVQGGTSIAGLNDRTIFAALEPLIGEFGGSTTGTGFQTAFNRTHGILSKPPRIMVNEMLRLGLWDKNKLEMNSMGGVKAMHGSPMVKDLAKLQETDTLGFLVEMMNIYKKKGIESIADVARENEIVFGRTGGRIYTKAMQQIEVMRRSVDAFDKSHGISETVNDNAKSPMMAVMKFHKALDDLGLVIGQTVLPALTPLIEGATRFVKGLNDFPRIVTGLTIGFVGLAGVMAIGGTLLTLRSGFKLLTSSLGGAGGSGGLIGSLGGASKGIKALQAAAGAFVAWEIGQEVGGWIKNWMDKSASKNAGHETTFGGDLYDRLHGDAPISGPKSKGRPDFVQPGYKRPYEEKNGSIYIDGRKVGEIVSKHQAKDMSRPGTGTRVFDGTMAPQTVGAAGSW